MFDCAGAWVCLEYVHPEHPPDEEYCDDSSRDVDDPVAGSLRFAEVEHGNMVAGRCEGCVLREIPRPAGENAGASG